MKRIILVLIGIIAIITESTSKMAVKKIGLKKIALTKSALKKLSLQKMAVRKIALKLKSRSAIKLQAKTKIKARSKTQVAKKNQLQEQAQSLSSNKIQTNSAVSQFPPGENPVLSKAKAGLYPFYPDAYETSDEGHPQVIVVQDVQGKSLLNRHDLDFTELCNLKQGYLGQVLDSTVEKYKDVNDVMKEKQLVRMRPAFTVLNNSTLSLFENENVRSLLKSVAIRNKELQVSFKTGWKGIYCFDVKYSPKLQFDDKGVPLSQPLEPDNGKTMSADALMTLCADSEANMNDWAYAITQFNLCEANKITVGENARKDFERTIKDEDEQFEDEKTNADDEQILEITNNLGTLEDDVRQNLRVINQYREEEDKKKKLEFETVEELQEKNNCLQEQLIEEAKKSEEQLEFKLNDALTNQVKDISKKDPFKETYKNRLYRLLQHKQNQIKEAKKMENDLRAQMMAKTAQFEANKDSKLCTTQPINQVGIKKACELMYQDTGYNLVIKDVMDCLNPETFCLSCCSHFIGQAKLERRNRCIDECRGAKDATAKRSELNITVETDNTLTPSDLTYQINKIQ